jgi:hypothetical protein
MSVNDDSLTSEHERTVSYDRFVEVNNKARERDFYKEQFERMINSQNKPAVQEEDLFEEATLLDDDSKKVIKTALNRQKAELGQENLALKSELNSIKAMLERMNPEIAAQEKEIEDYRRGYFQKYGHNLPREAAAEVVLAKAQVKKPKAPVEQAQATPPKQEEQTYRPTLPMATSGGHVNPPTQSSSSARPGIPQRGTPEFDAYVEKLRGLTI